MLINTALVSQMLPLFSRNAAFIQIPLIEIYTILQLLDHLIKHLKFREENWKWKIYKESRWNVYPPIHNLVMNMFISFKQMHSLNIILVLLFLCSFTIYKIYDWRKLTSLVSLTICSNMNSLFNTSTWRKRKTSIIENSLPIRKLNLFKIVKYLFHFFLAPDYYCFSILRTFLPGVICVIFME